jgi:hypothetical protein
MDKETEDYMHQLEKRLVLLEGRVAMLEANQYTKIVPPVTTKPVKGCPICGIGSDGRYPPVMGYACNKSDCPTRVTC